MSIISADYALDTLERAGAVHLVLRLVLVLRSFDTLQAAPVRPNFLRRDHTTMLGLQTGAANGDWRAGAQQFGKRRRFLRTYPNDSVVFEQRAPRLAFWPK